MKDIELLKWAGRYLESCLVRITYKGDSDVTIVKLSPTQLECIKYGEYDSCELVLKEFNDLSDEDFRKTFDLVMSLTKDPQRQYDVNVKPIFIAKFNSTGDISSTIADLLRELGYAVGIPREFYITEEEL
jgi:hypothetical protein